MTERTKKQSAIGMHTRPCANFATDGEVVNKMGILVMGMANSGKKKAREKGILIVQISMALMMMSFFPSNQSLVIWKAGAMALGYCFAASLWYDVGCGGEGSCLGLHTRRKQTVTREGRKRRDLLFEEGAGGQT